MINDKGLSVMEARNLVSGAGPHVDLVKLAFGTPILSDRNLTTKITVNVKSVGQECPTPHDYIGALDSVGALTD